MKYKIKKRGIIMKKHVFVAMAAMISMAWMTGCSGGESKETAADTKAESFGTAAARCV